MRGKLSKYNKMEYEEPNNYKKEGNGVLPCVSNSLLDKGKMLVEANEYADKCVKRTLFGKSRELAKQRIIVMYLLDEIDRLSRNDC